MTAVLISACRDFGYEVRLVKHFLWNSTQKCTFKCKNFPSLS
jgi:hypothetical protein